MSKWIRRKARLKYRKLSKTVFAAIDHLNADPRRRLRDTQPIAKLSECFTTTQLCFLPVSICSLFESMLPSIVRPPNPLPRHQRHHAPRRRSFKSWLVALDDCLTKDRAIVPALVLFPVAFEVPLDPPCRVGHHRRCLIAFAMNDQNQPIQRIPVRQWLALAHLPHGPISLKNLMLTASGSGRLRVKQWRCSAAR